MNIFEELRQDARGVALLVDWIGSGGEPVSQIHAEHRADACVHGNDGKPCPMNCEPGWWDRAKGAIAETIRGQLELKKKLNLHLSCDASLHMCKACGCSMQLKPWVPIAHIKAHTSPETIDKTPSFCWLRKELELCQISQPPTG